MILHEIFTILTSLSLLAVTLYSSCFYYSMGMLRLAQALVMIKSNVFAYSVIQSFGHVQEVNIIVYNYFTSKII